MFSRVTTLSWGKSERATDDTIEDASIACSSQGLFAIADGVGTALFSRLWAQLLVQHFAQTRLYSSDPFEMEWWIRNVQKQYEVQQPDVTTLPWSVQRKAREGSAATFAALSITALCTTSVNAQLFSIGDSCIFIGNEKTKRICAFPIQDANEFDKAPICLPSLPRKFNRAYHQCLSSQVELYHNDIVILATDAVAHWLLSHTDQSSRWQAFQGLAGMTKGTWRPFIAGCRSRHEMADDDATVVIIHLTAASNGEALGIAPAHGQEVMNKRQQEFAAAAREQDKEHMAILYGDGRDFKRSKIKISQETILDARLVAEALNEVRQAYFNTFNQRLHISTQIEQAWRKHESIFQRGENRVSVEKLLHLLQANGVLQEMTLPTAVSAPPLQEIDSSPDFLTRLSDIIRTLLRR